MSLLRNTLNCAGLFSKRDLIFQGAWYLREWWWVSALKYQVSFGKEPCTVSEKSPTQPSSSSLPKYQVSVGKEPYTISKKSRTQANSIAYSSSLPAISGSLKYQVSFSFGKEPSTVSQKSPTQPSSSSLPTTSCLFWKGALHNFEKEPYTNLLNITPWKIIIILTWYFREPTSK